MKRQIIIIGLLILVLGCVNSTRKNKNGEILNNGIEKDNVNSVSENSVTYSLNEAIWAYDFDKTLNDFKPIKLKEFKADTLTPQGMEKIINRTWPKIQIKYLATEKDTVFISIADSEVLTQQMGTTGADQFMISTTYSFTELIGVKYVSFEFEFGEHASPGVYNRKSWNEK